MKLGLERCAELLVEKEEDDTPTTYTYRTCPYTYLMCYRNDFSCGSCPNNPATYRGLVNNCSSKEG